MQRGSISINGRWWIVRVRENVLVDGRIVRKAMHHNLALVEQYPRLASGKEPPKIRAMADEIVAPINSGKREGLSIDSVKSYLESFIAAGRGKDGRPVRPITVRSWRRDYNVIRGLIPDAPLRSIRTPDVNKLFKALVAEDGEGDDMRATSAYRNIRNFLSGAFRAAVGDGLMDFNPVRDAMTISGNPTDTHATTLEELKQLMRTIAAADNPHLHMMRAAFVVAFFTGLRKEEVKGLKWTDYDPKERVLHIRRTVVDNIVVEDTKTEASKAPVPVILIVAKELAAHLKHNSGDGFIFHQASTSQAPVTFENIVREYVHPACNAAGVKFYGFHALRRGLNTVMKDMGLDYSLRADIMRHTPRNVTDKHYGRASIKQMRLALEKVEAKYKKVRS
jgi:integrase